MSECMHAIACFIICLALVKLLNYTAGKTLQCDMFWIWLIHFLGFNCLVIFLFIGDISRARGMLNVNFHNDMFSFYKFHSILKRVVYLYSLSFHDDRIVWKFLRYPTLNVKTSCLLLWSYWKVYQLDWQT